MRVKIDRAVAYLRESAFLLRVTSGVSPVVLTSLTTLQQAVVDSTLTLSALYTAYKETHGGIVNRLLNAAVLIVLVDKDQRQLALCINRIDSSLCEYRSAVSFQVGLRDLAKLDTEKMQSLRTMLKPVSYTRDIANYGAKYCPGTRLWVFDELQQWMNQSSSSFPSQTATSGSPSRLFVFLADAGMGKTVLSVAIIQYLRTLEHALLLGVVMFDFSDPVKSSPRSAVKSLAYQIAQQLPEFQAFLYNALEQSEETEQLDNMKLTDLFDLLIRTPLSRYTGRVPRCGMFIVFDALDEVGTTGSAVRREVLNLITKECLKLPPWVHVFVTSRPEDDVVRHLAPFKPHIIHDEDERHQGDLRLFMRSKLEAVLESESDLQESVELLVRKSEGKFVYLATLADSPVFTSGQKVSMGDLVNDLPDGLNDSYTKYFQQIVQSLEGPTSPGAVGGAGSAPFVVETSPVQTLNTLETFRSLLRLLAYSMRPLLLSEVHELLFISPEQVTEFLILVKKLHTVFPLRVVVAEGDQEEGGAAMFTCFHKSVVDWLRDETRSREFFINGLNSHKLFVMNLSTKFTDNGLCRPFTFKTDSLYLHDHFIDHLIGADMASRAKELMWRLPWLQKILEVRGAAALMDDFRKFDHQFDTSFRLLQQCLQLSLVDLKQSVDPAKMLPFQITSRMQAPLSTDPRVTTSAFKTLLFEAKEWQFDGLFTVQPVRVKIAAPGGAAEAMYRFENKIRCITVLDKSRVLLGFYSGPVELVEVDTGGRIRLFKSLEVPEMNNKNQPSLPQTQYVDKSFVNYGGGRFNLGGNKKPPVVSDELNAHQEVEDIGVYSIALFSDKKTFAAGCDDGAIRVWSVDRGECDKVLEGNEMAVTVILMIDGDQKLFSGSADSSVRMWDVATSESEVIYLDNGPIFSLIHLPAERQLLIGASAIILWDLDAYTALKTLGDSEIDASFTCMALLQSKVGKDMLLAVGSTDGLIRVWNATQGVVVSTLGEKSTEDGSGTHIVSMAVLPDGRLATGSNNSDFWQQGRLGNEVRVWDISSGECLEEHRNHSGPVRCVSALSEGRFLTGSSDCTLRVWNTPKCNTKKYNSISDDHTALINSVIFLRDGRVVTASLDATIKVWNTLNGQLERTLEGHEEYVMCLSELSGGRLVSGSQDCDARVWNVNTGLCLLVLKGHIERVTAVTELLDGRIATCSMDQTIRVFNSKTGRCDVVLQSETPDLCHIAAITKNRFVCSSKTTLVVWEVDKQRYIDTINCQHYGSICTVEISTDNTQSVLVTVEHNGNSSLLLTYRPSLSTSTSFSSSNDLETDGYHLEDYNPKEWGDALTFASHLQFDGIPVSLTQLDYQSVVHDPVRCNVAICILQYVNIFHYTKEENDHEEEIDDSRRSVVRIVSYRPSASASWAIAMEGVMSRSRILRFRFRRIEKWDKLYFALNNAGQMHCFRNYNAYLAYQRGAKCRDRPLELINFEIKVNDQELTTPRKLLGLIGGKQVQYFEITFEMRVEDERKRLASKWTLRCETEGQWLEWCSALKRVCPDSFGAYQDV